MKQFVKIRWRQLLREDDGVLSFEWTLLVTLVVLGIVGGLAGARDAIIDELGDVAEAVVAFDQSYSFVGIPDLGIPASSYADQPGEVTDGDRSPAISPLPPVDDGADGG